jgi:hypothetical protein
LALMKGSQILLQRQPLVAQVGKLLGQPPKRFPDQFCHNFRGVTPRCTDALLHKNALFHAILVTADHC